jgi:hypothetical protein
VQIAGLQTRNSILIELKMEGEYLESTFGTFLPIHREDPKILGKKARRGGDLCHSYELNGIRKYRKFQKRDRWCGSSRSNGQRITLFTLPSGNLFGKDVKLVTSRENLATKTSCQIGSSTGTIG